MHERTRYLIQHRVTKAYIQSTTDGQGTLTLTVDPWKAWSISSPEDALRTIETNIYMPEDRHNYRIVKVIDTREVSEDGA